MSTDRPSLAETVTAELRLPLAELFLSLGDDALIAGHRLSEWCGHAPQLEEDIALANIALDEIGRANVFLMYAGELEGEGRDQDRLAYFRSTIEFKNLQLLEQPNTDFAFTIARQFLFDAYALPFYQALSQSSNDIVAGLAAKASREITYHLRHTRSWILRLGDGTEESRERIQHAIDDLWMFTEEISELPESIQTLIDNGIVPDGIRAVPEQWREMITSTLKKLL